MPSISVRAVTNATEWGAYNSGQSLLTALRLEVQGPLVSGGDLPPGSRTAVFSLCPHLGDGAREPSGASFRRALIPLVRAPPCDLIVGDSTVGGAVGR